MGEGPSCRVIDVRILHVFSGTAPGHIPWAESLIGGLCLEQIRAGHEVTVVATNADAGHISSVPIMVPVAVGGVPVIHYPVVGWLHRLGIGPLARFSVSTELARSLSRLIPSQDVVHLHFVFPFPSVVAARACHKANVPYVVSLHGNLDPYMQLRRRRRLKQLYLWLYGRRMLNRAAVIHLTSEGERQMVAGYGLTAAQNVVELGVRVPDPQPSAGSGFRTSHPEIGTRRILLYLGRLSYSKGLDVLAAAFSRIAAQRNDVHLVFVGPDDHGFRRVIEAAIPREVRELVTFTGRVSEKEKFDALANAEIFVFPSHTEAFGLAMLEAMASGIPVVVSEQAALARDLAEAGAVRTTPLTSEGIVDAVTELLDDKVGRSALASAGKRLAQTRFSWRTSAVNMQAVYEKAVIQHHSP
jgi:glycosyltransferase involved in cell wall biosynthesis